MNCKPGDLAVIVRGEKYCGRLVEVLKLAIEARFILPDGYPAYGEPSGTHWLVKFVGGKINAPTGLYGEAAAGSRMTSYAVVEDYGLRPLRDNPGTDETLTWAPVPHKETA